MDRVLLSHFCRRIPRSGDTTATCFKTGIAESALEG